MGSRKRGREEMEAEEPPKIPSTLHRLQNTWEFACLAQYIFTFGRAVKVEDIDIEVPSFRPVFVPLPLRRRCMLITLCDRISRRDALHPTDPLDLLNLAWRF